MNIQIIPVVLSCWASTSYASRLSTAGHAHQERRHPQKVALTTPSYLSHTEIGQWESHGRARIADPFKAFINLVLASDPAVGWHLLGGSHWHRRSLAPSTPDLDRVYPRLHSRARILLEQRDATATDIGNSAESSTVLDDDEEEDPLVAANEADTVLTDDICLMPGDPQVRIEVAPTNSRRIFTGVDIFAPMDSIWSTLTDYEHLQDVVPSLVSNTVVFRTDDGGARLSQVGGAKVVGIKFKASTVLDVVPYDEEHPIPPEMLMENLPVSTPDEEEREFYRNVPLKRNVFPRPYAYTTLPHRDLTMQNVAGEGDFLHYQGVWRMQELPNCAPPGKTASRLTYAVEIQPKGMLPVRLIEGRIAADLKANLMAIKEHVEGKEALATG